MRCEDEVPKCPVCAKLEEEIAKLPVGAKIQIRKEAELKEHIRNYKIQYNYTMHLMVCIQHTII